MTFLLSLVLAYPLETGTIHNIPTKAECERVKAFMLEHSKRVKSASCKQQKGGRV
jgi:hypothetical protein